MADPDIPVFPLTIQDTLLYYDTELIFTALDAEGRFWYVTATSDWDGLTHVYLIAQISDADLALLVSGQLGPYAWYKTHEQVYIMGAAVGGGYTVKPCPILPVPDEYLPDRDAVYLP
jgi:hypothetical protein